MTIIPLQVDTQSNDVGELISNSERILSDFSLSKYRGDLGQLAEATVDLALASLVLGAITAVLLLMVHELLMARSIINSFFLRRWMRFGPLREILGERGGFGLTGLPYRQLCGQLSARAAAAFQYKVGKSEDAYLESQILSRDVEAQINALQRYLGTAWLRVNYILSLALVSGLVAIIVVTPNSFVIVFPSSVLLAISVGAISAMLAPLILQLLERYFSAR